MVQQKKQRIATTQMTGVGTVNICYVGGSTFEILNQDGTPFAPNGGTPINITKNQIDKLLDSNKIKLTDRKAYADICSHIRPDGSTDTHNADGTPKSKIQQTLFGLREDGYIDDTPAIEKKPTPVTPAWESAPRPQPVQQPAAKPTPEPVAAPEPVSSSEPAPRPTPRRQPPAIVEDTPVPPDEQPRQAGPVEPAVRRRPARQATVLAEPTSVPSNAVDAVGNHDQQSVASASSAEEDPFANPDTVDASNKLHENLFTSIPGDLNGDGKVDHYDRLIEQEQSRSGLVVGYVVLSLAVSVALFFGIPIVVGTFTGNNPAVSFEMPEGSSTNTNNNAAEQDTNNENTRNTETNASQETTVTSRTDYDPEDAVAKYPMADETNQKIAKIVLETIRGYVSDGKVTEFNNSVALSDIADTLSPAYVSEAGKAQNLNDAEKNELQTDWRNKFIQNEKQHVADKDLEASIFGGRVREVRQDNINPYCLYVVMEAVNGDHQRICFIVTSPDGGTAWNVTGVTGYDGYIKMICEGRI